MTAGGNDTREEEEGREVKRGRDDGARDWRGEEIRRKKKKVGSRRGRQGGGERGKKGMKKEKRRADGKKGKYENEGC